MTLAIFKKLPSQLSFRTSNQGILSNIAVDHVLDQLAKSELSHFIKGVVDLPGYSILGAPTTVRALQPGHPAWMV